MIRYFILAIILMSCSQKEMKPQKAAEPMDMTNVVVIDVRSKGEFDSGHVKNAIHIPHTEIESKIASIVTDKNQRIMLYCASGMRSGVALNIIKRLGYTNATNEGGYAQIKHKLNQ